MGSENFGDDDSNFNDAELQDIMSEIESLEKEFVTPTNQTTDTSPNVSSEEITSNELEKAFGFAGKENGEENKVPSLQEKIEAELQEEMAKEKLRQEESEKMAKIVQLRPQLDAKQAGEILTSSGDIYFNALGPMSFNLSFKIGTDLAHLNIDPKSGLKITMKGVELTVSADSGYSFVMENGAKLIIPVTSEKIPYQEKKIS